MALDNGITIEGTVGGIPAVRTHGFNTNQAVNLNGFQIDTNGTLTTTNGVATSTAGAATISQQAGQITTEALTTAAGAIYTMTLTNTLIAATSKVMVSVGKGTATTGIFTVAWVTPAAGSAVIILQNIHATAAINGTVTINFVVFN